MKMFAVIYRNMCCTSLAMQLPVPFLIHYTPFLFKYLCRSLNNVRWKHIEESADFVLAGLSFIETPESEEPSNVTMVNSIPQPQRAQEKVS